MNIMAGVVIYCKEGLKLRQTTSKKQCNSPLFVMFFCWSRTLAFGSTGQPNTSNDEGEHSVSLSRSYEAKLQLSEMR